MDRTAGGDVPSDRRVNSDSVALKNADGSPGLWEPGGGEREGELKCSLISSSMPCSTKAKICLSERSGKNKQTQVFKTKEETFSSFAILYD